MMMTSAGFVTTTNSRFILNHSRFIHVEPHRRPHDDQVEVVS